MALVLTVDDASTTSLALLLKQAGHASRSADSPAEALGPSRPALHRRLEKHGVTP